MELLLRSMDRGHVDRAVLVQPSAYGRDHRYLLAAVAQFPDRFVAIGLVDTAAIDSVQTATKLVRHSACVGLRVNLAVDLDYAARQATAPSWAEIAALDVPVCIRATPAHHTLLVGILAAHPLMRIVIDHLELSTADEIDSAVARIDELAGHPGGIMKVAGLGRASGQGRPYKAIWPLIEATLRSFGSDRVLWGSDFPDSGADSDYAENVRSFANLPFISSHDRDQLMFKTASELWLRSRSL